MSVKKMTSVALAIAIVFLMTVVIAIPITNMGFVNIGDSGVLVFASMFNPATAGVIGGVGSALADISLGYSQYAIFTLLIKGLEGLVVSYLFHKLPIKIRYSSFVIGILIMIAGYYVVDVVMIGNFLAVIPAFTGNALQGGISLVIAIVLQQALSRVVKNHTEFFE